MDTLQHAPPEVELLREGTLIDQRYRVVKKIGAGGFATVYQAQHERLVRPVAIKVLELPDTPMNVDPFVARFMREAQLVANLKHPSIIGVHDFGVLDQSGRPYIAMDLLEGRDLEQELRIRGPLSPKRALAIFDAALDALAVAHNAGIVHKDLKPSNLFLQHAGTEEETVIVLDFGVAGVVSAEGDGRLTATGSFVGTPAYLAPEYIEHGEISPAVDVYQMGLILIEALTGRGAVRAKTVMAYLLEHAQGHVHMPSSFRDHPIFGDLLLTATALDPKDRFQSAAEFREALAALREDDILVPALMDSDEFAHGATMDRDLLEDSETTDFPSDTPNRAYHTLQPLESEAAWDATAVLDSQPISTATIDPPAAETQTQSKGWGWLILILLLAAGGTAFWTASREPQQPPPIAPSPDAVAQESVVAAELDLPVAPAVEVVAVDAGQADTGAQAAVVPAVVPKEQPAAKPKEKPRTKPVAKKPKPTEDPDPVIPAEEPEAPIGIAP